MEDRNLITVGYGRQTTESMSLNLYSLQLVPANAFVTKLSTVENKPVNTGRYPVSPYPEVHGMFFSATIEPPEGTLIAVKCTQMRGPSPLRQGMLFLRTRKDADWIKISIKTMAHRMSTLTSDTFIAFNGRADILDTDTLSSFGVTIPGGTVRMFTDPEELEETFIVETIDKGVKFVPPKKEKIATRDGDILEVEARARRVLKLR